MTLKGVMTVLGHFFTENSRFWSIFAFGALVAVKLFATKMYSTKTLVFDKM